MLQVYFPEGSLQFEIRTAFKENLEAEPSKRSRSTNFEESRRNLLKQARYQLKIMCIIVLEGEGPKNQFVTQACLRIDTQRKHQILLKESTKNNEEVTAKLFRQLLFFLKHLKIRQAGKEIVLELGGRAQQAEIDKVWRSSHLRGIDVKILDRFVCSRRRWTRSRAW